MNFSQEIGIFLDENMRSTIKKVIKMAGGVSELSRITGIPQPNISMWKGDGKRKGEYITWRVAILKLLEIAATFGNVITRELHAFPQGHNIPQGEFHNETL